MAWDSEVETAAAAPLLPRASGSEKESLREADGRWSAEREEEEQPRASAAGPADSAGPAWISLVPWMDEVR